MPDSIRFRYGRDICADLAHAEQREWLLTNGIGGYASGTLSGLNTRGYHGLLVAALAPPVERTLMLVGLIETLTVGGETFELSTIRWHDGSIAPRGQQWLQSVRFDGQVPVWTFAGPGFTLEKRVWMDHGANVTRIAYSLPWASGPASLRLGALTDFRQHHSRSRWDAGAPEVTAEGNTLRVAGPGGAASTLWVRATGASVTVARDVYRNFDLAQERARGLEDTENHVLAGHLTMALQAGQGVQVVATAGAESAVPESTALDAIARREAELLQTFAAHPSNRGAPEWVRRLVLAADQFIVRRTRSDGSVGHSVIAGYHWFADWGRDTMISLRGLALTTGRPEIAKSILMSFADVVDAGMVPNRFPDSGTAPEYNTIDATFWFIDATAEVVRTTGDKAFAAKMAPTLFGIVEALREGTRYGIKIDAADGLICGGAPGVQLTWMDAKLGDWVVTPRIGKPIEVNALWISGLRFLVELAEMLGEDAAPYEQLLEQATSGFARFWNPETGYAFDVIDGPEGDDATLRPNQIFAARGATGVFSTEQRQAIVEVCEQELLTPAGLRSLGPDEPGYCPHFSGPPAQRDPAYHQGTVWGWLIGPFIEAHLDAFGDVERAAALLAPMADQLAIGGISTISEVFEAEAPHPPRGCIAQAWSVAETLRAWRLIQDAPQPE